MALRNALRALLVLAAVAAVVGPARSETHGTAAQYTGMPAEKPAVTVYKSPYCGCCEGWVEHMEAHGYAVTVHDMTNLDAVKRSAGVPAALESCHTAVVDGYALEGHVPAGAVDRLLTERPGIKGLAVPGMPIGSPGMEGPDPEPYDVMTFGPDAPASVFMSVPAKGR